MTVMPNFLGLGVQRCGTTWLYHFLKSHPDIYLPEYRKEIHFFDKYYDNGQDWYAAFFEEAVEIPWRGEITPKYIYAQGIPEKIKTVLGEQLRFLVMLRDPVERFVSAYHYTKQRDNLPYGIEEFYEYHGDAFERGLYFQQLDRWFSCFNREQFLILFLKRATRKPEITAAKLGRFFQVDPDKFRLSNARKKRNALPKMKFRPLYSGIVRAGKWFRKLGMDRFVHSVKATPVKSFFETGKSKPSVAPSFKKHLFDCYSEDIRKLEQLLDVSLDDWKQYRSLT